MLLRWATVDVLDHILDMRGISTKKNWFWTGVWAGFIHFGSVCASRTDIKLLCSIIHVTAGLAPLTFLCKLILLELKIDKNKA